jgi:hypothetical protein
MGKEEKKATGLDLWRAATIQKVVDSLASGRNIQDSCEYANISTNTWYAWRKEGLVADVVNTKFKDVTSGVRDLVSESMVGATKLLCYMAQGKLPPNTSIGGIFAPRDAIAASAQLLTLWDRLGGDIESKERDQERMIEELIKGGISVTQVQINTVNIGSEAQPMPVLQGAKEVIVEGEIL